MTIQSNPIHPILSTPPPTILYYICSGHRINPKPEPIFGTNLISYIWIIQSDLNQNNLHAEGLELESICTMLPCCWPLSHSAIVQTPCTDHNLIKYIWIIQSNPIWSKIICVLRDLNLRGFALCCHAADHWTILPWCKLPVAQIYCRIPKGEKDLPNESKNKFCCVCILYSETPTQIYD